MGDSEPKREGAEKAVGKHVMPGWSYGEKKTARQSGCLEDEIRMSSNVWNLPLEGRTSLLGVLKWEGSRAIFAVSVWSLLLSRSLLSIVVGHNHAASIRVDAYKTPVSSHDIHPKAATRTFEHFSCGPQ